MKIHKCSQLWYKFFLYIHTAHFSVSRTEQMQLNTHTHTTTWPQPGGHFTGFPQFMHALVLILTAASSPVTLRSVMQRRVTHLSLEEKKGPTCLSHSERTVWVGRGHAATLLGRNLSEPDFPLAAGGASVCVCVLLGYVNLKPNLWVRLCTEPPCCEEWIINAAYEWIQLHASGIKCRNVRLGVRVCDWYLWPAACDAETPVLPLQSDALSGAFYPTPTQHGTEVLWPRTQDRPRNPIKQVVARHIQQPSSGYLCVSVCGFEVRNRRGRNDRVTCPRFIVPHLSQRGKCSVPECVHFFSSSG